MEILLNDVPCQTSQGTSVAELLEANELSGRPVAVEVNEQLVPKAHHAEHQLKSGDRVEIVTLVGGG